MNRSDISLRFAGLDTLSTAVLIVDERLRLCHANSAAENLFAFSMRSYLDSPLDRVLPGNPSLFAMLHHALDAQAGYNENDLTLDLPGGTTLHASCVITPIESGEPLLVLEFRALDQQLKIAREEKLLELQQLNRELMRNLAHEIKNPLGGIRGAAQLLERELPNDELVEYTQVIVKEADRLQTLMDRLLTPHRLPQFGPLNVHEVLERVRSVVLAEFPADLRVQRDYDVSLPDLTGDKEQLIQAMLNVARNAAQALNGKGTIRLCTRIARNVTLARTRYRQAIQIDVIDDGPGVPELLQDKIFYPLVSGRDDGTGLGLSLAQNFVHQHSGIIEFESEPGRTRFTIMLPLTDTEISSLPLQNA
jgi:two-component system nitrogen regulation sensor histidine kinase GlnL